MDKLTQKKLELARLRKQATERLRYAFDAFNPDSKPTPTQDTILRNSDDLIHWVIGSNRSGKSALGGRIVSWWFENNHPYQQRPAEWGDAPLQIIVIGRLGEQIESELWEKKIKPFLKPGTYKEHKVGAVLQRVTHHDNKNRIIFLSHHDAVNAREKVQAFTANVVWLDEMPDYAGLISELVMRVLASKGKLYGTFTPLLRNEEIRRIVDSNSPKSRKYNLLMLDNPIFAGREEEITAQVRANSANEAEFRARMYGEWYAGDVRVVSYYRGANGSNIPTHYDPVAWRHQAVLDPAASGKAGLVVGAEDPTTGRWYVVKAKYIKGSSAHELLTEVEQELIGYRITHRVCDCNPAGFYKEAARRGVPWRPFTEKNDRKLETIDKLNDMLNNTRLFLTPPAVSLEEELLTISWDEKNNTRIVNASKYHLFDALRYLVDTLPVWDPAAQVVLTPTQEIRQEWKKQQAAKTEILNARRSNRWKRPSSFRSLRLG